ncbi:hypothetical protein PR003_g28256 [Phytophthora rubi]|uniref:Uncharacterized protein n=1 Tax=Phytophthora rubi TaxID=129364 RepID=A0A6A4BTY7_9STRA|nr:hypothetical protein PR001_g27484 [Phytophthora rubi]KAE8969549.1 hypothetical protein PR002_g27399 [Phytophthora rubi]KAE9279336.1 hypothetical protein PR003_g28256 [Phytophthora rubi]
MVDRRDRSKPLEQELQRFNGKLMITTAEEHLARFGYGVGLEFDALYPVFVPAASGVLELDAPYWRANVDDLIKILPLKEMYQVFMATLVHPSCEEHKHEYLWMLRWLQSCLELSEMTRCAIQEHLHAVNDLLHDQQRALRNGRFVVPVSDAEARYRATVDYWMAVNFLDIAADEAENKRVWQVCQCKKCIHYRSPEWTEEGKPEDLTPEVLPVKDSTN